MIALTRWLVDRFEHLDVDFLPRLSLLALICGSSAAPSVVVLPSLMP
jgi:hypothetical protein